MKKNMLFAAMAALTLFGFNKANAQWTTSGTPGTTNEFTDGNVGIGFNSTSTAPASLLHIKGNAGNISGIPAYYPVDMIRITPSNITGTLSLGVDDNNYGFIRSCSSGTGSFNNIQIQSSAVSIVGGGSPPYFPSGYMFTVQGSATFGGIVSIGNINSASSPYITTPSNYCGGCGGTGYSLYVQGGILTEKIKVASHTDGTNWSDFVFDKSYKLRSLRDVEKFISKNHHLPEIPSAEEVKENGVDLLEMDAKLLQKIEELTLYMIDMKKENEQLKKDVSVLQSKINK